MKEYKQLFSFLLAVGIMSLFIDSIALGLIFKDGINLLTIFNVVMLVISVGMITYSIDNLKDINELEGDYYGY